MLNKEEEYRLASFLGVLRRDIKDGLLEDPDITLEAYLWLAEKLKEINEELRVANMYSSIVVKETDMQRDFIYDLKGQLEEAQLKIDQLEGKA